MEETTTTIALKALMEALDEDPEAAAEFAASINEIYGREQSGERDRSDQDIPRATKSVWNQGAPPEQEAVRYSDRTPVRLASQSWSLVSNDVNLDPGPGQSLVQQLTSLVLGARSVTARIQKIQEDGQVIREELIDKAKTEQLETSVSAALRAYRHETEIKVQRKINEITIEDSKQRVPLVESAVAIETDARKRLADVCSHLPEHRSKLIEARFSNMMDRCHDAASGVK